MVEARRVGAALRWLRLGRKLSQQQVAGRVGVSQPMYSRIEAGTAEPGITLAPALAEALGVSLGELLLAFGFKLDAPELTISGLLDRMPPELTASPPNHAAVPRPNGDPGAAASTPEPDDASTTRRLLQKLDRCGVFHATPVLRSTVDALLPALA